MTAPRVEAMTSRHAIPSLTRWVLAHKRLVVGFWVVVTIAGFAAIGPANKALSLQFTVPGGEASETNDRLAAIYG
ncbi:MAG: hypothetical protein LC790_15040, partial [Actinobacteria bacterium]|nr:hypothetical protein [Actinomycetota bacterium]